MATRCKKTAIDRHIQALHADIRDLEDTRKMRQRELRKSRAERDGIAAGSIVTIKRREDTLIRRRERPAVTERTVRISNVQYEGFSEAIYNIVGEPWLKAGRWGNSTVYYSWDWALASFEPADDPEPL